MAWPSQRTSLLRQRQAFRRRRCAAARQPDPDRSPARSPDARPEAGCSSRESRIVATGRAGTRRCRRRRSRCARAAATAASPICSRSSVETAGEGVSSMTFWCRRWIEQSRSPRWITLPCRSAKTWISTWRASAIARSRISSSEPKALAASERPRASACGSSSAASTSRMPRPPPPAAALTINGKPMRAAFHDQAFRRPASAPR